MKTMNKVYNRGDINLQHFTISDNKKLLLQNRARYVVAIVYEDFDGEMGFYDFWDDYLYRIKEKAFEIIKNGHPSYPSIPLAANPRIAYLYDTKENKYLGDLENAEEGHRA
jgi:hypothetical protein